MSSDGLPTGTWGACSPTLCGISSPRVWLARQRFNARVGLEYLRYRRRLSGRELRNYALSGPDANRHVPRVLPVAPDRPLRIFAFWKHYNWENYNLLPALCAFGEVVHYDPTPDFDPAGIGEPDRAARKRMQEKLWDLITEGHERESWDVLFFYVSGVSLDPAFLERLRALGIPMINFGHDDIVSFESGRVDGAFRGNADIARFFTVYACTSVVGFHKALAVGAVPYYMPGGGNPEIYRPLPGVERDLDVVLVGANFYDRGETISYLQRRGVRVHAYGYGWPNGPVSNHEQIELLNRAKIVLGFNRCSGSDWMGIKGRDHEVPMTGAFHLVNAFPELSHVYRPGVEVAVYRNRRDLAAKVRYYLAHPEERERIAQAGRARAIREHSWQQRFRTLFTRLGLLSDAASATSAPAAEGPVTSDEARA